MSALVGHLPPPHYHHHNTLPLNLGDIPSLGITDHYHTMRRSQRNIDRANRHLQTSELFSLAQEKDLETKDGLTEEDPPSPKPVVPNGQS